MYLITRTVCSVVIRQSKPVFVQRGLCRYRYLSGQENRLRPTDIRVSGVRSLRSVQSSVLQCSRLFIPVTRRFCVRLSYLCARNSVLLISKYSENLFSGVCWKHTNMPDAKPFVRLPKSVVPEHYELLLKPDLKTFLFEGKLKVKVQVKCATDKIVLNTLDLTYQKVEFIAENGGKHFPSDRVVSVEDETLTLLFPHPLACGKGELLFEYTGEINDKMKGFYRSKYVREGRDGKSEQAFSAVTQLCATQARRMFPCWDEPAVKAQFSISLVAEAYLVALSNMPVVSQDPVADNPGMKLVKFDTTPIMSTYLVAVVVGEYDYVEDHSSDGVVVRVYTPIGKKEQGRFALEVATKVLPYYKEYFQIAYPLPKMDLIAIADFSAGAMENWGLVTYRETCLLVDPENTSAERKQWIALVVGHELAHQWFGNLVTMEWWTHLWLNEGYASFVEFLCVAHLFPEYDIWTQFVCDTYSRALELDWLKNSHPIEVPVGHPSEIDEIFDDISYNKGASVIRMLHKYIGDEDFRKGMNLYLTRHQYKNTFTEDLWTALEEASNKPVGAVMSTWTKQTGYPVVKVSSQQEGSARKICLTQEKFCADNNAPSNGTLWMVPITISTSRSPGEVVQSTVLETHSAELILSDVSSEDWVKVNPGTVGFYRTQYPSEMLAQFVPAVKDKSLPPLDRLGLLDDLFALVQAGQAPTVEVLKLMEAYQDEDNFTVWSSINSCLVRLSLLLSYTDYEDSFKAYGRKLMSKICCRLGWDRRENESHLDTLLRSLVIGRLAWFEDENVINQAKQRFADHVSGKALLPADLRSPVYKAVLSVGDEDTYNTMLRLYREADLHEEKDRISRALGAIRDESVLKKILQFAISDEVRSQDSVFVIISVAMTRRGRELAWDFIKENWKMLWDRYEGGFLLSRLVKYPTENFSSEERAQEVEQFFKEHPSPGTERTVQQCIESIRLNAEWLARDQDSIRAFLTSASQ
ncbi:Aminopeptidase [Gryllus bimaculatus]|nr:Aminopeptidase [Gryllus bimaculatus]